MGKFLDLRKKEPKEVIIVEKVILKKRGLFAESFRLLFIIAIASGILWTVSHADDVTFSTTTDSSTTTDITASATEATTLSSDTTTTDDIQATFKSSGPSSSTIKTFKSRFASSIWHYKS